MIRKNFHLNWEYKCPDAVLTCSILKCKDKSYVIFGGHDKTLYLMDPKDDMKIIDEMTFDGWVRCSYTIDLDEDGYDEALIGSGDGSFVIVKFDLETKKLKAITQISSTGKVTCCVAGDLTNNGNQELIFGGDDKSLKIFNDMDSEQPKFTLYYDSWVTSCAIGLLKLPEFKKPINGLIVGTKNGGIQLIQLSENNLDIIWQRNVSVRINDIAIGDVTNDGYNEIVLGSNDSYIKILNGEGKNLRYINVRHGRSVSSSRPLCLFIDDIDGDKAKEIITGCADGTLKVYHNPNLDSINFELKWKTKTKTSIESISTIDDVENGIMHIIYGGYDRTIRSISDFKYGKKPVLDVPLKIKPPVRRKKLKKALSLKKQPIPTNIRDDVINILKEKKVLATLDLLIKELQDLGYSRKLINEEIEKMKLENSIRYETLNVPVWSFSNDTSDPNKVTIGNEKPQVEVNSNDMPNDLENSIIKCLQEKKIIPTKSELINSIISFGFNKEEIENQIEILKNNNKIIYSSRNPRGWMLVKE